MLNDEGDYLTLSSMRKLAEDAGYLTVDEMKRLANNEGKKALGRATPGLGDRRSGRPHHCATVAMHAQVTT